VTARRRQLSTYRITTSDLFDRGQQDNSSMGRTKLENSPGLSISLDTPRHHYCPGDQISGRVELNTAADIGIGQVVVSFFGRAKSKIIQQHGQSTTVHR
jgi:hypothetical protein